MGFHLFSSKKDREDFLRDYYYKMCMTTTIEELFRTTRGIQGRDMFQKILEQVREANPRNTEEDIYCLRLIMAKAVDFCLLVNYDGILEYDSMKIAEDMIGHPERDFGWLEQFDKLKRRQ